MNKSILSIVVISLAIVASNSAVAQPEIKSATYTITQVKQYNLQVVRIVGRSLTVDVEGFGRRRFQVPRDFTFDIDGESMTLNQIVPGQKLRAYVTETEKGELLLVQDEGSTVGVVGESVNDDAVDGTTEAAPEAEPEELTFPPEEAEPPKTPEPAEAPQPAEAPEPPVDDTLADASFESPPAELPATAEHRGWMAVVGGTLVVAGLGLGWFRRSTHRTTN